MEKNINERKFWLAIGRNSHIGSAGFSALLETGASFEEIFKASENRLRSLGLSQKLISEILKSQKNDPDQVVEELEKREIKHIFITDIGYPSLLKEIYDPPAILYYRGNLENLVSIGIVGSRKPTDYGAATTSEIASFLAQNNIIVTSGMAIGIDTIAHQAALDANGKTFAVLGCGLDQIYPSRNVSLSKHIIENGAVISEFPIGTPPLRHHFPIRNRVISGLSKGIVVTEATEKSGSLITAAIALEQNREVFAIPGSIYNLNSKGPNNLIKIGAKIIKEPRDILDELGFEAATVQAKARPTAANDEERVILDVLEEEPKHIDAIIKKAQLDQTKISSVITMMEISGKIKHMGGMVYKINY